MFIIYIVFLSFFFFFVKEKFHCIIYIIQPVDNLLGHENAIEEQQCLPPYMFLIRSVSNLFSKFFVCSGSLSLANRRVHSACISVQWSLFHPH